MKTLLPFVAPLYSSEHHGKQAYDLARHEAGHYVVALVLGFDTGSISVCIDFTNG